MNSDNANVSVDGLLYAVIGILVCLVVLFGGYFVYKEYVEPNESNNTNETTKDTKDATEDTTTETKTETNKDEKITCSDCKTMIKSPNDLTNITFISEKILLGNKIRKIEINPSAAIVKIDDKTIFTTTMSGFKSIDSVFVINNEVMMIVEGGSYVDSYALYFYDEELNEISVDTTLSQEYSSSMHIKTDDKGRTGALVEVNGNKIIMTGSRRLTLEPIDSEVCSNGKLNTKYTGELYEAKYEIEYLGNNKFSKAKQIEVLKTADDSICD